ncbi:hypothetical protein F5Y04DRAFT_277431 [Hypomontagnella monticulosa]|nr:hypothetical protein F5Y04DRAFT_277431 [Hypomontagnella monticulosa]
MHLTSVWFLFAFIFASIASATPEVKWNYTLSGNSSAGIHNGTHMNDLREICNPREFDLVTSMKRRHVLYLKGTCKGIYSYPSDTRCSFLDLTININGEITPQKFGNFMQTCEGCVYYNYNSYSFLSCYCLKDDQTRHKYDIQMDGILYSKNGFLSCWGFTNFECPLGGYDY